MDLDIVALNSDKNCRVCLMSDCEVLSLFNLENTPPYNVILTECASITVEESDGLPMVICKICHQEMLDAHKFVTKCRDTDKKLRVTLTSIKKLEDIDPDMFDVPVLDVIVKHEPESDEQFEDLDEFKQEDSDESEDCSSEDSRYKPKIRKKRNIKKENRTKAQRKINTDYPKKCPECEVVLKCESAMVIHMRKHTNERPYQCTDCGECFKLKSSLKSHCIRRHGSKELKIDKGFTCSTCLKTFYRKKELVIHNRTHTGETPHSCKFCPKAFNQVSSLIRHTRIHTGERPYECQLCHKRFPSSSELTTHKKVHSNEKKFSCFICKTLFKSKNALRTHGAIHANLKDFICDKCGMSFNKKGNLKSHFNRMHSETAGQCCVCNKKFSKLSDHMRTHTGEKPFECDLCNKRFSLKSRLLSHMTYHRGLDKHVCQVEGCDRRFPKQSMLVFHILKYHKKQTPFICKHCKRGFYRLSDLKRHLRLNHSDEPNIMEDLKNADLIVENDAT